MHSARVISEWWSSHGHLNATIKGVQFELNGKGPFVCLLKWHIPPNNNRRCLDHITYQCSFPKKILPLSGVQLQIIPS